MRFTTYTNSMDTLSMPEWIRTERYMYCDNFVNDYMNSDRFSLAFVMSVIPRLCYGLRIPPACPGLCYKSK